MAKTLNKDGTPRKIGSGKTKGAGCYTDITWAQLKNSIGEETNIPVSRVWINSLGISTDSKPKKKHPNKAPQTDNNNQSKQPKELPKPKVIHIQKSEQNTDQRKIDSTIKDYEPPPLFASKDIELNQY